ncbi:Hypothetical predicted protein, partial [Pelobates cultripes]
MEGAEVTSAHGTCHTKQIAAAGQRCSEAAQISDVAHQATVAQRRRKRPKVKRRVGDPLRRSMTTLHHKP